MNYNQAALAETVEFMNTLSKTQRLPLAPTWAPCAQQAKAGCRHIDNYLDCVSTVETACFMAEVNTLGFHEVYSDLSHPHGHGIVGITIATNKPCFPVDIIVEHPLALDCLGSQLQWPSSFRVCYYTKVSMDFVSVSCQRIAMTTMKKGGC